MGTRGAYGFHKNGVDKITYNQYDSYPSYLGKNIENFIRSTSIEEMNKIFDNIQLVNEEDKPTVEQLNHCLGIGTINLDVSRQSLDDWYCLLRKAQGDLNWYKKGLRYMIDNADFIKDSLFCEWAYVINLDNNTFEVYEGFQKRPHDNRYKILYSDNGYYNCKLIREYPLDDIPLNWVEEIESAETV